MTSEQDRDIAVVQQHLDQLIEHFDSVQIFATRGQGDGNTGYVHLGAGNFYANYGAVREWMIRQDEMARMDAREDD